VTLGGRRRVVDAWVAFVTLSGLGLWLVIDHTQYPTMSIWARISLAGLLAALGLWLALAERKSP